MSSLRQVEVTYSEKPLQTDIFYHQYPVDILAHVVFVI